MIEHFVSLNDARHFTGARFTINVAANAHLQHIKLAFENPLSHHFAHNDLLLAEDATAFSHSFLLGGAVLRHNTSTQLNGENSTLRINSLAMPVKNEVCDTRTGWNTIKVFVTADSCTKLSSATKAARYLTV